MNTHKCENCGSTIKYDPQMQNLNCEYCGSTFAIEEVTTPNHKKPYNESVTLKQSDLAQYHCNSCGSNLNTTIDTKVKRCPNCASADLVLTNNICYTPDGIVPFKISKEQATANFYNWIKKRSFAPNDLKKMAKLGKISGFYTPVWNFDCSTKTIFSGVGVNEDKDSNGEVHTHKRPFRGETSNNYTDVMFSANKRISDYTLKTLGNFGLDNLKVYNIEYLCGFIGTNFDFDILHSYNGFTSYVNSSERNKARNMYSARYDRIENFNSKTEIYEPKYNFIYLPIWANYYTYKNKQYTCYINGHSGKITGRSPISFWKIFLLCLGIFTIITSAVIIGLVIGLNMVPEIPKPNNDFPTPFLL